MPKRSVSNEIEIVYDRTMHDALYAEAVRLGPAHVNAFKAMFRRQFEENPPEYMAELLIPLKK